MFTLSITITALIMVILGIVIVYLVKKNNHKNEEPKIEDKYETQEFIDEYGILHTRIFNKESGHLVKYIKSNGEEYTFHNDEQGRLDYFKNHLGLEYLCTFNDKDQIKIFENKVTGKRESYEYDEHGRVSSCINLDTKLQEWFYYNEETGKVWRIKDSDGRNTYNLCNMPKNWEVQHV